MKRLLEGGVLVVMSMILKEVVDISLGNFAERTFFRLNNNLEYGMRGLSEQLLDRKRDESLYPEG
jgi:hypothetical protein